MLKYSRVSFQLLPGSNSRLSIQTINEFATRYPQDMIIHYTPTRLLCSSTSGCSVLPIAARIKFKTLVMTYKCINRPPLSYVQDLIIHYTPTRLLRSFTSAHFMVPRTK
ncbi:hypothetical protein Z043_121521, partial [Scleropages formosus]